MRVENHVSQTVGHEPISGRLHFNVHLISITLNLLRPLYVPDLGEMLQI